MKKIICYLLAVPFLICCSKSVDPAPYDRMYEMTYQFINTAITDFLPSVSPYS